MGGGCGGGGVATGENALATTAVKKQGQGIWTN